MTSYQVLNPATGEHGASYPLATDRELAEAISSAAGAFGGMKKIPLAQRQQLLRGIADLHEQRAAELARLMAAEMGKPVGSGRGEIGLCAEIYRYHAEHAEELLADEPLTQVSEGSAVLRMTPIGVVLGIMPWNYPYYQVARFAAPNLLLGNSILLKHAPQCPESALAMEQIFTDAGLLPGGYQNVFLSNDQVAATLADDRIRGVSLTGSERAGEAVAQLAGKHLKKVVLELGGSDAFIVIDTDDMDELVERAIVGRMGNCGQACNAAKRFFVPTPIYPEFVERFAAAVGQIEQGDPMDEQTSMGPLSSVAAADGVEAQVRDAVEQGAVVHVGGTRRGPRSAFFEPTVLTGVRPGMRAYTEEIFGPVAVVHEVPDVDTAVALANESPYGLSASVHASDPERALAVADRLEVGMVYINEAPGTAAELPFGGVKRSGFGRELGKLGVLEFANRKLIRAREIQPG